MENLKEAFAATVLYVVLFLIYFAVSGRLSEWSSLANAGFTAVFLLFAAFYGLTQKLSYFTVIAGLMCLAFLVAKRTPTHRHRYVFLSLLIALALFGSHAMQLITI